MIASGRSPRVPFFSGVPSSGRMANIHALNIRIDVRNVQSPRRAKPDSRLPQQCKENVLERRVIEGLVVSKDFVGSLSFQHIVGVFVFGIHTGHHDLVVEVGLECFDRPSPLQEHPERAHDVVERHGVDLAGLLTPETELLNVPPGEIVEIVDFVFLTPLQKLVEVELVIRHRCFRDLAFLVVDEQFGSRARFDWL